MTTPTLIRPDGVAAATPDPDKSIDVRFVDDNVLVNLTGSALRPRHLFMAAAILSRLANRMIDAGEQSEAVDRMAAAAVSADLARGRQS